MFVVDECHPFSNFVFDNRELVVDADSYLCNPDNERTMVTFQIGQHRVEIYDDIAELPIARFHKYQKMLLVDAGVGADITAFDQRIEKMRRFLMAGKPDKAQQELENLRQCVFLIQNEISPQHRAFATLVTKIDGKECTDISDDALNKIVEMLADAPISEVTANFLAVKKKIDAELMLYFPQLFNDSTIKEYYDLLKKRAQAILNGIIDGLPDPAATQAVEELTTALVTFSNPKIFAGSDGVEVQFDRQYENLCLMLSEQLHVDPKQYTVLEFYNAFDFIQQRARKAEQASKRPKSGR